MAERYDANLESGSPGLVEQENREPGFRSAGSIR